MILELAESRRKGPIRGFPVKIPAQFLHRQEITQIDEGISIGCPHTNTSMCDEDVLLTC